MLYLGAMILVWAAVAYLGGLAFLGIARAMRESRYEAQWRAKHAPPLRVRVRRGVELFAWWSAAFGGLALIGWANPPGPFAGVLLAAWLIGLVALSRILRCR